MPDSSSLRPTQTLVVKSIEEIVRDAVANMAIEGYLATPAEIAQVTAQLRHEDQLLKNPPSPSP